MSRNREFAVVTGAASGIGRATAQLLVDKGCWVLAVDKDSQGLEALEAQTGASTLCVDLGDPSDRSRVIAAGEGANYLVNAAGAILLKPIGSVTVEDWRKIQTVNAEAIFFLCQGLGPTIPAGGAIVNLSSSSAKLASTVEAAVYAASKTTILSITRSFAYALANVPVRVNAVCPAIIDTPMQDAVLDQVSSQRGITSEELRISRNASIPMGRPGRPEELARLIWFLLSDGGGYMTGQAINFGGGMVTW